MIVLAFIAAIGILGLGCFIGAMIHVGHPIKETPVVRHEAVIVCLVPRRYDEVA